ncbi:MAG TPA: UDP-N-acetylmuramate dehydrogenase [Anaerolineales bacterium]|nr:UDP-N-acetylmuramate dehydrogenase [Anaerolineales bacterium]
MTERNKLRSAFGASLREYEPLAKHTTSRLGGPAEFLVVADSAEVLAEQVRTARQLELPFFILGAGANVLISDSGVRGLVIVNRAREMRIDDSGEAPSVRVESGATLSLLARQCAARGLSGLEWAAGIPGTVGGAIYGNAGAHGSDIAASLRLAEILQEDGRVKRWETAELAFGYRASALKRARAAGQGGQVVLAAEFGLIRRDPVECLERMDVYNAYRRRTQPPGASLGSMFKNPPGDYAGRLIEAAGLKGLKVGGAEISPVHANFFLNTGEARASDVFALIHQAHTTVKARFDIDLALEVELVGEWGGQC